MPIHSCIEVARGRNWRCLDRRAVPVEFPSDAGLGQMVSNAEIHTLTDDSTSVLVQNAPPPQRTSEQEAHLLNRRRRADKRKAYCNVELKGTKRQRMLLENSSVSVEPEVCPLEMDDQPSGVWEEKHELVIDGNVTSSDVNWNAVFALLPGVDVNDGAIDVMRPPEPENLTGGSDWESVSGIPEVDVVAVHSEHEQQGDISDFYLDDGSFMGALSQYPAFGSDHSIDDVYGFLGSEGCRVVVSI